MAFPREDIERVRTATDLAQLIGEVTRVKKTGRTWMAVCPFHQEKSASMSIDPRGLYHCFGCGKSGDVFRFLQESQALDFAEAVEVLARRAGIELHREPGAERKRGEREGLVEAMKVAVDFYHQRLRKAGDAGAARRYLRSRGYDGETVEAFQLGFAPADPPDALVAHLRAKRVTEARMIEAGLGVPIRSRRIVDRFRGRVLFPIWDLRGDPVGFGARKLEGEGPKYLNSPETPLYHKSQLLYGLHLAKAEMVRAGMALVVEGYTDVIGLHQAGFPVAVATCGTALGATHLDLLRRFTEKVVLAFDADEAGVGASLRGFEQAVPGDLDLRVALLPAGKDPADLVQEGRLEELRRLIGEGIPLLQFRLERELSRFRLDEPEARGKAIRATGALVALHPDAVVRHEYSVFLSRQTGVDLEVIERAVDQAVRAVEKTAPKRPLEPPAARTGREKAEQELLRLLLANHPDLRSLEIGGDVLENELHKAAYARIAPLIVSLPPGSPPNLGVLADGDPAADLLVRLANDPRPLADPAQLGRRLQIWDLEAKIRQARALLERMNPEKEEEAYSHRLEVLLGWEMEKRELQKEDDGDSR